TSRRNASTPFPTRATASTARVSRRNRPSCALFADFAAHQRSCCGTCHALSAPATWLQRSALEPGSATTTSVGVLPVWQELLGRRATSLPRRRTRRTPRRFLGSIKRLPNQSPIEPGLCLGGVIRRQ